MIPLRDSTRLARVPIVTFALLAANVLAYLLSLGHGGSLLGGPSNETVVHYGAIPYELSHLGSHCDLGAGGFGGQIACSGQPGVLGVAPGQPPTWETIFTGMFLHANVLHLAGNMLFLVVFGMTLEDRIGRVAFLAFYLLSGFAALALQVAVDPASASPTLGASGAIAGVLGGYILLFPRARVLTVIVIVFFFRLLDVPAWLWLAAWLLFDGVLGALGVLTPLGGGAGVAYYAHIGGFAFGLLAVRAFARRQTYAGARTA